ncbi:MAG: hypothetical protein NWE84_09230 [Candidatus Bathyarchaeota archaeon]|nr:hypothetical protein [Candidatus Bathyarchaeota archaeon]
MILDLPVVLDYGPAYEDYNNRIIKTLQQMAADGRKRATMKYAVWTLRKLNRHVDLMNPDAAKLYTQKPNDTQEPFQLMRVRKFGRKVKTQSIDEGVITPINQNLKLHLAIIVANVY